MDNELDRRPSRAFLKRLLRSRSGRFGLTLVLVLALLSLLSPLVAPFTPLEMNRGDEFEPPSARYVFGTDQFGRDIFSRVLHGGRISLLVGFGSIGVAALIGVGTGLLAGYLLGWVDSAVMRLWDVLLAFPNIFLGIAVVAVLGPGSLVSALAIAAMNMPHFSRITRAAVIAEKQKEYVEAARAMGASDGRIAIMSILPNTIPPLLAQIATAIPRAILLEASLSFLGLGTQPPRPSWGNMLEDSRDFLWRAPWYGLYPGLALFLLVLGLIFLANAIRDLLDPTRQNIE
ncbi:MAG: ABC transporter permease [Anaerolineaceae bacterium]|nr:ABC transporter permease [Anaerolineaceae bacterium]MDE0328470.1 ABC transporter permease [Anaerolineaceae bacterium]